MTDKMLERLASVKRRTGLCASEIYKMMREGSFPKKFPLSKQAVAWDAAEIDKWIDAKLAARKKIDTAWRASRFGGRAQYPAKKAAKIVAEKSSVNYRNGASLASAADRMDEAHSGFSTGKRETLKPITNIFRLAGGAP